MVTKKDFIYTAKTVAQMSDRTDAKKVAEKFAEVYSNQNPRFDINKFYKACNVI